MQKQNLLTLSARLWWIGLMLAVLLGLFATGAGAGPGLLPAGEMMTPTGQVGGMALAVETNGSLAFVGVGPRVEIFDLTKVGHPWVGRTAILPGVVRSLTSAGERLYASLGSQGVVILDISDPANPAQIGTFSTDGRVTDVAIFGDYAYVTSVFDSFRIFNVSVPSAVTLVAEYGAIFIAEGVKVSGGYAYVAAGEDGLVVVDVSAPATPQPAARFDTGGYARDVVVGGMLAFVADGYGNPTILVISLENLANPVLVNTIQTPGEAYALDFYKNTLLVATWDQGMYVVDINNPAAISIMGSVDTPGRAVDVAGDNNDAYVADDWGGWRKIDITDPAHPTIVGETITPGEVRQVAVDGDRAVILDNSLGVFTVDVADPAQPSIQGRTSAISGAVEHADDVALFGSYAYVIQDGNVRVMDMTNPDAPVVGNLVTTPGMAQSLAIHNGHLLVADGVAGFHIYPLKHPASPQSIGTFATAPDEAKKVLAEGQTVYLVANGLRVVDITYPNTPTQIGYYKPSGLIFDMALAGHRLYLNGKFNGIWTVNVSAPATPAELGHYDTFVAGPIAATEQGIYVSDDRFSPVLRWVDMTNPVTPTVMATYPTQVRDMAIADGTLYVAGEWSGLLTFPVPKGVSVSEVRPNQGRAAWANLVHLYGSNFQPDATAQLISSSNLVTQLAVDNLTASHLEAVIPAGLPSGVYGLRITNPDGGTAILPDAYTVLPPDADILSAYADELWVGPKAARQNEATGVGLVVHRAGGSGDRADVSVDFYVGDPAAGGQLLGSAAIPGLSPNSYTSTLALPWTPTTEGNVDLYAVITPGSIPVSRTVTVLPPNVDTTPPVVNSFAAPGAPDFASPNISLTVGAADNPGGSGVGSIYIMEFDWNANVGTWMKVGESGWRDYTSDPMTLTWSLNWSPGTKNLVAWAADRAGNVSESGQTIWINFVPPAISVNQGMWQMFSYWRDGGQSLSATATPVLGDPDLYLCCDASGGWIDWSTQAGTVPDTVSMLAPSRNLYTVGVYGWTTARYGLSVSGVAAQSRAPARDPVALPAMPSSEAPPQALPVPPRGYRIYLPLAPR